MAITKDLGIVSAYGYAKSKGYTGTEEEFALLMANYAEVAGEAEAWAAGTKAGVPVPSTDPTYHNNAKYYADAAGDSASAAAGSASAAATDATDAHADAQSAATNAALAVNSATAAEASKNAAAGSASTASTKAGEAANSATAAAGSATSAGQSAGTATTKAGEASASATAAAASASAAASSVASLAHPYDATATYNIGDYVIYNGVLYRCTTAITTAEAWNAAHWTAATLADDVEAKANPDGFYENMSVGNAEQLLASVYETEKVPYLFRTSGGSLNIGDRETDEIHGGSLAWNQLVAGARESGTVGGFTVTAVSDYTSTFVGTLTSGANIRVSRNNNIGFAAGHKYFVSWGDSAPTGAVLYLGSDNLGSIAEKQAGVFVKASAENSQVGVFFVSGVETNFKVTLMLCDLTLMFGSQIADYIYQLEQSNAGAGVAYFRKLFPKPFYSYDAGSLKSVKTSAHRMTGFNQLKGEFEIGYINTATGMPTTDTTGKNWRTIDYSRVIGGATYYCKREDGYTGANSNNTLYFYDADKNFIGSMANKAGTTTEFPQDCAFVKVCGYFTEAKSSAPTSICINLHCDGERDGEYEPYKLNTYALDPDLELRGVFKLDANNSLYCDGDIYKSDGTVRRRYGIVDLGTIDWDYHVSTGPNDTNRFSSRDDIIPLAKHYTGSDVANAVCARYVTFKNVETVVAPSETTGRISIYFDASRNVIVINDTAYSTSASFKASLSGVYLIYELAEETEETAEPYTNPQIVDDWGTEEYVDERDVPIPVGHSTQYMPDLRAKLETAPESPDGNGDYILRQTNGVNSYVPLVIPDELPAAPSEDGTYTLAVTVSGGVATYSWVSTS